MRMKRVIALFAGLSVIGGAGGTVYADQQPVSVSLAEIGAVESPVHSVPFGQCGIWEVTVNGLQIPGESDSFSLTSPQLADLLEAGIIQIKTAVTEGSSLLRKKPVVVQEDDSAVLKMTVEHTYGTQAETLWAEIQFIVYHTRSWNKGEGTYTEESRSRTGARNPLILERGDTLISQPVEFTAYYNHLSDYQSTVQVDSDALDQSTVLADGEELYMAAGKDNMLTLDFEGDVFYTTCVSAAQKTVNLFYSLEEIDEIAESYPEVSFQFISFPGTPSFINSGELSFPAIGGQDTAVYSYEDGELVRLESAYDTLNDRIVIRSVKRLGSYVVASESIEELPAVQPEEPRIPQAVKIVLRK